MITKYYLKISSKFIYEFASEFSHAQESQERRDPKTDKAPILEKGREATRKAGEEIALKLEGATDIALMQEKLTLELSKIEDISLKALESLDADVLSTTSFANNLRDLASFNMQLAGEDPEGEVTVILNPMGKEVLMIFGKEDGYALKINPNGGGLQLPNGAGINFDLEKKINFNIDEEIARRGGKINDSTIPLAITFSLKV